MPHEALGVGFHSLIAPDALLRVVGSGFAFTEGPIWHPKEQALLFSDIPGDAVGPSVPQGKRHDL
jgi:gluconolactonase